MALARFAAVFHHPGPQRTGDHGRLSEIGTRYQQVQEELAWKLLEWERVQAGDGLEV